MQCLSCDGSQDACSLLVDLLKDRNLGHLTAHPLVCKPSVAIVNDLEVYMLTLLLPCMHQSSMMSVLPSTSTAPRDAGLMISLSWQAGRLAELVSPGVQSPQVFIKLCLWGGTDLE